MCNKQGSGPAAFFGDMQYLDGAIPMDLHC